MMLCQVVCLSYWVQIIMQNMKFVRFIQVVSGVFYIYSIINDSICNVVLKMVVLWFEIRFELVGCFVVWVILRLMLWLMIMLNMFVEFVDMYLVMLIMMSSYSFDQKVLFGQFCVVMNMVVMVVYSSRLMILGLVSVRQLCQVVCWVGGSELDSGVEVIWVF